MMKIRGKIPKTQDYKTQDRADKSALQDIRLRRELSRTSASLIDFSYFQQVENRNLHALQSLNEVVLCLKF